MANESEILDDEQPIDEHLESDEEVVTHGHHIGLRDFVILVLAFLGMMALYKFLPFAGKANAGLAILFFVGVLWLTEALHVTITALLVPVLAVAFGLMDVGKSLSRFADPTIFLFFGGFALATALHVQGIDRWIANRLLQLARGHFGAAAILLMLATAGLSMWISNTATAAMMLPLALGILGSLDVEKDRNTYVFVLLGVAYAASIGGLGTPVGSPPNTIAVGYIKDSVPGLTGNPAWEHFGFTDWMSYGLPVMFVMLPAMIGVLYLIFRPNFHHRVEVRAFHFRWTSTRITSVLIFLLAACCWIFSKPLMELSGIGKFDEFVAVTAAVLVGVTGVARWKQIQENTEWGVLLLFGGGLTLSALLGDSGASKVLADGVKSVVGGAGPLIIVLTVAAFIICLTELSSNTAAAALLIPLFGPVGVGLGMPGHLLPIVIGIGASLAFMLPVATPPNAIVFGTGYIKQKEMIKAGFWLVIVAIAVVTFFGAFVWHGAEAPAVEVHAETVSTR
ncbi:transporter divalent anion:Na+ symporter (DASS) family protein [Betaproteobacteria bacterium]|nr:transporter divalent anion:Na+ symporter (DASS) family protein [Betaproteobacteria bacterium]GHT99749.1 transporter divalent anion:Na+ symporter (DASS) family protein [Betaproteobacteria bacterium]GHU10022.1 transporter divalent anion:Na+ symporter (DASS) family protein [Betaproteobacteria bacterium]GHU22984.1 transporter divalent anion:Na+ symporter (DASS) family protein [Betaproteobacteria bacterium]GHU28677.1 transporter divalent anion:Na+ symporter (DASS) family protein [Betaproteobacter